MVLGAIASAFAAAWRFLGVRSRDPSPAMRDALCALPGRIREADDDTALCAIEREVDALLHARLAESGSGEEGAQDASTWTSTVHRLDNLIHQRRMLLAARSGSG